MNAGVRRFLRDGGSDVTEGAFDVAAVAGEDLLSRKGALDLKRRIEAAWRARGRVITIRIVGQARGPGLGVVFGLESDALNGLPPKAEGGE